MCYKQHLLLVFCLIALTHGRKVNQNFPLLEFHEIHDVKLIIDYKSVELLVTKNVYNDLEELMQDLNKFDCEFDICKAEKRFLTDDILQKNSTLNNIANLDAKNLNRKKREWPAWGNFLKWSGGVMNSDDRSDLHRYLINLYENITLIGQQVTNLESKINQPAKLKAEESDEVNKLKKDVRQLKENLRIQNLKEQFAEISVIVDAVLSSYINGHVDGLLIDEELLNNLDSVRNSLRNDRQFTCKNSLDCIRNAKAKIVYKNDNFHIVLELPIATFRTMKLYKVESIPAAYSNFVLILNPQQKYFLLDEENDELLTINDNFVANCISNDSNEMFCKAEDVITNVNKMDCLYAAQRDNVIDIEVCANKMELLELESYAVIKMDKGTFWIFSESSSTINTSCHGDNMQSRNITGAEIIKLPYGCHADINSMKLISYSTVDEKQTESFYANISIESFKQIIKNMESTIDLSENIPFDLQTAHPSGLKEKSYTRDESWQAKNQWKESEINVLQAEYNKALIIALVITIAALMFIVFRKRSIFIVTNPGKDLKDIKYDEQSMNSELDINLKADIK
ncbi:uncharacterized protein [Chironomus tepperi]|uniref:uncharacterized protein n=1 Tax=Chironomus tepperi TaxID=113505 RepID=UPI00391F8694